MKARSGKMAPLLIVFLVLLFLAFMLVPLGVLTGFTHGARGITFDAWHVRPWFPLLPALGLGMFFLILWIAVIVWVYKDAEQRGMNGLLWSLLVFFGHLIGLLVFLIVRQDHPVGGAPAASKSSAPPASRSTSPPPAAATRRRSRQPVPPARSRSTGPSPTVPIAGRRSSRSARTAASPWMPPGRPAPTAARRNEISPLYPLPPGRGSVCRKSGFRPVRASPMEI